MKKIFIFLLMLYGCKQDMPDPTLGVVEGTTNGEQWKNPTIRSGLYKSYCSTKLVNIAIRIPVGPGLNSVGLHIVHIPPAAGKYPVNSNDFKRENCHKVVASWHLSNYDVALDRLKVLEDDSFLDVLTISKVDTVENILEGELTLSFGDSEQKTGLLPDTVVARAKFTVPIQHLDL